MIVDLQLQNINISKFEIALDLFKENYHDATQHLLKKSIKSIDLQNEELNKIFAKIEKNPKSLLEINLEELFDTMLETEDNSELLQKLAEPHKNKSDMFMGFYKSAYELYCTACYVSIEIGFLEAELKHSLEIKTTK